MVSQNIVNWRIIVANTNKNENCSYIGNALAKISFKISKCFLDKISRQKHFGGL